MKIIGATKDGYLVQMSEDEAAKAAGCYGKYSDEWRKMGVGVGSEIRFTAAMEYHTRVRDHQESARKSAGILRALADMLEGSLPEVIIPEFPEIKEGGDV